MSRSSRVRRRGGWRHWGQSSLQYGGWRRRGEHVADDFAMGGRTFWRGQSYSWSVHTVSW